MGEQNSMDAASQVPAEVELPKHILDIWVIVLIILATIVIMTSLLLCPATAVIIYRMRAHPILNGAV
ncbi:small integral membrane protein 3 isoform 1-T1 [Glossophaga mutica]